MAERNDPRPGQAGAYDTKDHPLDPPSAPAISTPVTDSPRPPARGGDRAAETMQVFAVLGLLGLVFILFIVLMVGLQLSVF